MTITNVYLPSELSAFVTRKLDDGSFKSSDDLMAAAVQLLKDRETAREALLRSIADGFSELDRGESVVFDAAVLKQEARQRLS